MSFWEVLLLALALCVDSFVVSTSCALHGSMTWRRGILMALIFAFFQSLFPLLGALLGAAARDFVAAVDHWIAFGLLFLVGGKMVVDALRDAPEEKTLDVGRFSVLCLLGVATSIDAFVVGIGLGLDMAVADIWSVVAAVAVATFLLSLAGYVVGSLRLSVPQRLVSVAAGLLLIGLGVFILIEHLTQG